MRSDTPQFDQINADSSKEPRYVIGIDFDGTITYIPSHDDIAGIPGTPLSAAIEGIKATTQTLNPDRANSTIGSMSFSIIDPGSAFTDLVRANLDINVGLRGRTVTFYIGWAGFDWSDMILFQTQVVRNAQTNNGQYKIDCADIQRETKTQIFDLALTYLTASITDADTTIPCLDVSGFEGLQHGPSYTDAPNLEVIYIKLKQTGEIVRCPVSGIVGNSFTNCVRGRFGTKAQGIEVDVTLQSDRRPKVEEYVYLELPGVKLAKAILTGEIDGGADVLPSGWHAGIPSAFIRDSDFTGIGIDLWDTTDDEAGIVLRFDGIEKQDAKRFLETEIYLLLGLFSPVYADGQLGLKRMLPSLNDSPWSIELNDTNVIGTSALQHDMESLQNNFRLDWNWNGDRFIRSTVFVDSTSIARHGTAKEKRIGFRGLAGTRFTTGLIGQLLTSFRDMYSGPPLRLDASGFLALNQIEVGDTVRVDLDNIRDFSNTPASLQRTMAVHGMSVDWLSGVKLKLFGSAERLTETAPTADTTILPAGFYTQAGTDLATVPGLITGNATNAGTFTLAGNADMNAAGAIFYFNGDLTISTGTTLQIDDNVQLRINGFLTVNGTVSGNARGILGSADAETLNDPWEGSLPNTGTPGFLGPSISSPGLFLTPSNNFLQFETGYAVVPQYQAFPNLVLQVDDTGNGSIAGIPSDLRGCGGVAGGRVIENTGPTRLIRVLGGAGGDGGSGLLIISKGGDFGVSGLIDLGGGDGIENASPVVLNGFSLYAGTGGAGGPGALLWLLDGASVTFPDIGGKFSAVTGEVQIDFPYQRPIPNVLDQNLDGLNIQHPPQSFGQLSNFDMSGTNFRIQFLAGVEDPEQDQDTNEPQPGTGLSTFVTYSDNSLQTPPINPTGDGNTGEWRRNPADLTNTARWISTKNAVNETSGTWTDPVVIAGLISINGKIEASQALVWNQARFAGPYTPSTLTNDLDCTFSQDGADIARIARRVTLDRFTGLLTVSTVAHSGGDLNTGRVAVTVTGSGTSQIQLQFDYVFGDQVGTVIETVVVIPAFGDEMVTDPDVTAASFWNVVAGPGFIAAEGADSDGALEFVDNDQIYVDFTDIQELPEYREGGVVHMQYRTRVQPAPSGPFGIQPSVEVYDANGVLMETLLISSATTFGLDPVDADEWYDNEGTIQLLESDFFPAPTGPRPWRIAVGLRTPTQPFGHSIFVDKFSARYLPAAFAAGSTSSNRILGLVPPVNASSSGKQLTDSGVWKEAPGGLSKLDYAFDSATGAADPGSNEFRFNNATLANVTAIYINDDTSLGEDLSTIVSFLRAGDRIYIEQGSDETRAALFEVQSTPTDNTGWWTISVSVVDSATGITNTQRCSISISFAPTVGSAGVTSFLGRTGAVVPQQGDYANVAETFLAIQRFRNLRVEDAGGTDYLEQSHNGSNFLATYVNTGQVLFSGATSFYSFDNTVDVEGDIAITGGNQLQVFNALGTDIGSLSHDDDEFFIESNFASNSIVFRTGFADRMRINGSTDVEVLNNVLSIAPASGDAQLDLIADPTNTVEGDNPSILFSQNGAVVRQIMGFTGFADTDSRGNVVADVAGANDFVFHTLATSASYQFGIVNQSYVTIGSARTQFRHSVRFSSVSADFMDISYGAGNFSFNALAGMSTPNIFFADGGVTKILMQLNAPERLRLYAQDDGGDNFITWFNTEATGTRRGFIGYASSSTNEIFLRNEAHGEAVRLQGESAGGTNRNGIVYDVDVDVSFFYAGVEEARTQNSNGTDNITGLEVMHWDQNFYDVGLAKMPRVLFSANTTISDTHWHKRLVHDGTAGATLQLTFNTETSQGQDVVLWVQARNGPVTLVDGTMVLEHFDGGGAAPPTGNITVARGGWATVVKDADSLAHVTGVGLS